MLRINVVTLFPEWFTAPLGSSILGRAATAGLVRYRVVQLRDYTHDKHRTVDDTPYGGGAGMVLKPEPFFEAVEDLQAKPPIVLLSARGRAFTHETAVRYAVGRLLPEALGDNESAATVSHYEGLVAPPSYTRPASFRGLKVPDVFLGDD